MRIDSSILARAQTIAGRALRDVPVAERAQLIADVSAVLPSVSPAAVREALVSQWTDANEAGQRSASSAQLAPAVGSSTTGGKSSVRGDGTLSPFAARAAMLSSTSTKSASAIGARPTKEAASSSSASAVSASNVYRPVVVAEKRATETPRAPVSEPIPEINYARNVDIAGVKVVRPTTMEGLRDVVASQPHVRALGRGHSFNHILSSETGKKGAGGVEKGAIVDMRALNAATIHNGPLPDDKFAWVEAGITIEDLNARLAGEGLELRTAPMVKEVTVGGALATGSHGVGLGVSNFGDEVLAMEVMDAKGKIHTITDEKELKAHRVALGSMGIITRVKLRAQDTRPMRTDEQKVGEGEFRARYQELMATNARADMFLFVGEKKGEGRGLLRVSDYVKPGEEIHLPDDNKASKLVNHLEEHVAGTVGATALLTASTVADEWFGERVGDFVRETVADVSFMGLKERKFTEASHALNHRFPGHTRVETAQWAVPKENLDAALDAIYDALKETDHTLNMPVYIRNLAATDGTTLGVNSGRDSVMLEVYSHHTDETPVDFYRTLERKMAALDGRPHLAKLMWDAPADLYDQAALAQFQEARAAFDPTGKFANAWSKGFFFSKNDALAALSQIDFTRAPSSTTTSSTTALPSAPLLARVVQADPSTKKLVSGLENAAKDAARLTKLASSGQATGVLVEESKSQAARLSSLAKDIGAAKAGFVQLAGNGTKSPEEVFTKSDVPVMALDGLLNDFARMASGLVDAPAKSGEAKSDLGLAAMNDLARALHGEHAMVLRDHDGRFALWSRTDPLAPAKVATLPTNDDLSTMAVRAKSVEGGPPALGSVEKDRAPLAGSASLAHFARPSGLAKDASVADLMGAKDLTMKSRPDPTGALSSSRALQDKTVIADPVELKVMTYNVALLDVKPYENKLNDVISDARAGRLADRLGNLFSGALQSPNLDRRRDVLPERVFATGQDVILLQEVWSDEDVARFTEAAKAKGYVPLVGPRVAHPDGEKGYNDGLMTFVKADVLESGAPIDEKKRAYTEQDTRENRIGAVKRGYQEVRFVHKELGPITVFNTHLQAYPQNFKERMSQTRELGLAMAGAKDAGLVVGGGDLNAGAYYAHDEHSKGLFKKNDSYFENSVSHFGLLHYAGASDAALMGRPASDAHADMTSMHQTPAAGTWPHTATETNGLYRAQYDEISSSKTDGVRMDHIVGVGKFQAKDTSLLFTDVDARAGTELSDHFAVSTTIVAERVKRESDR